MRRNEIKAGTVYGEQRTPDSFPTPVVILATDLYAAPVRNDRDGKRFVPARPSEKPGKGHGYGSRDRGYPAVLVTVAPRQQEEFAAAVEAAKAMTVDQFAATGTVDAGPGLRFVLVTNLAKIGGEYQEVQDRLTAAAEARRTREAKSKERRAGQTAAAEAAVEALRALGIEARVTYGHFSTVTLVPSAAAAIVERLAAL